MKKKNNLLLLLSFLSIGFSSIAQELLPPLERFSTKKASYLIKSDGSRVDFVMDDLDRKKGLIIRVEGKSTDGKKIKLEAKDIKELAIAPSDFAKFSALSSSTKSVLKASKTKTEDFDRSLVYFYQEYLEDRKITALMQRLNPDFDSKIRVYHDPFASETMGLSVGGIQVTGGIDKSYYLKVDGKTKRYFKGDYNKDFKTLFGSCIELTTKFKDFAWRDLPDHIFFLDQECK
jgi:hypothetical protein